MSKAIQDGLILDNSFLMIDEKKSGFRIPARMIQILAVLIGSFSAFWVLLKSVDAPVNITYINATILIWTGIMFVLCVFSSYGLVKLFFLALFYCLFLYSRLPQLKNGFYLFENLVIRRLYENYNYEAFYFVANETKQIEDTTLLTIMIIIPVIALFTFAVVRNRLVNICSIILFLPVAASFLVGVIPAEKYLIAYIAAILYLAKSGLPFRHVNDRGQRILLHRISSRAAVWMSLLGLLVFFILKLFVSEEQYDNIAQLNDMKEKVQQTFMETSIQDISEKFTDYKLFEFEAANGGLLGGELGKDGIVEYTGSEQLIIEAPYTSVSSGIYLKGYVGSDYTGKKWAGHTKADKEEYTNLLNKLPTETFPPVNQTNLLINNLLKDPELYNNISGFVSYSEWLTMSNTPDYFMAQSSMQVEYKDANKRYIYAPYYTNYELLDRTYYDMDLYTAPAVRSDNYEYNYYYNVMLSNADYSLLENLADQDYINYERLYRDYVYDVYTKLPEIGLDRLKKDYLGNTAFTDLSLSEKLDYVKNYLNQNAQYTLSPGKLPKDKDFVEYFLYENKKGYCSHFASAAALILRAMGVPARYAEGYAIGAQRATQSGTGSVQEVTLYTESGAMQIIDDTVTITVRDSNAHAWVEVYADGCGWIPIEFTPGAAIEYNTSALKDLSGAGDYLDNNETELAPTQGPEPTKAPINQGQNNIENNSQKRDDTTTVALVAKEKAKLDIVFIIIFIFLIIAAAGLLVVGRVKKRVKIRNTRNHNRRAILLFAEIEIILHACKKGLPNSKARLEDSEDYVKERSPYIDPGQYSTCIEIVKKARFSNGSISIKELRKVEEFRDKLYMEVYNELPKHKKLHLKMALFI